MRVAGTPPDVRHVPTFVLTGALAALRPIDGDKATSDSILAEVPTISGRFRTSRAFVQIGLASALAKAPVGGTRRSHDRPAVKALLVALLEPPDREIGARDVQRAATHALDWVIA